MVHQYKLNNYNIVLDTCSGSVHSVDDVAYDIIAMYPDHPEEEIVKAIMEKYGDRPDVTPEDIHYCIEDITTLKNNHKLFTPDTYEPLAGEFKKRNIGVIKALCLHVSHTCNLNCEYCFASQGKYHGEKALMSLDVGKRAIDFLIENSGSRRNLEVDFFGGEPLLNWDVCKQIVAYARAKEKEAGKHFRFTVTTNGMLIDDDVIDFCNKEISNVVLSLDGRKEVHDRTRVDYKGHGSYDRIVPKFQKIVKARGGKNYYMRGTFTHNNTDFTKDVLHMADLGFTELSMEPVVSKPDDPLALTKEDLPVIKEQYELLAKEMLKRDREGRGFTFYHYMIDLKSGPCIYKRISGCDIYHGVTNHEVQEDFRCCNAYARPDCQDCWAKLYCSGGCAANAYHATGSVKGIYEYGCELFRKRMECAIMLQVAEDLEGIDGSVRHGYTSANFSVGEGNLADDDCSDCSSDDCAN